MTWLFSLPAVPASSVVTWRGARTVREHLAGAVRQAARTGNLALLRGPRHPHHPVAAWTAQRRKLGEGAPARRATKRTAVERVDPVLRRCREPSDIGRRKRVEAAWRCRDARVLRLAVVIVDAEPDGEGA